MKKNSGWKPNAESWKVRYQGSTLLAKQNTNKKGSCPKSSVTYNRTLASVKLNPMLAEKLQQTPAIAFHRNRDLKDIKGTIK